MNLNNLFEGAVDELERRRIEDLEAKMDDLAHRARVSKDQKEIAALRHEFAKCKAERDSYYQVREWQNSAAGEPEQTNLTPVEEAGSPAQQAAIAVNMKKHHQKPKANETVDTNYKYIVYVNGEEEGEYSSAEAAKDAVRTMRTRGPANNFKIKQKPLTSARSIKKHYSNRSVDEAEERLRVSPHDQGAHAAIKGKPYASNPHPEGSKERLEWTKGHNSMRARKAQDIDEGNPNSDPWYVYAKQNPMNYKKFKTHEGAKAYAEKHGLSVASAGYFHDHVKNNTINEEHDPSPVASAIVRRIMFNHPDLLQDYGPNLVNAAVSEVADYVGDVDEIGSSDVSSWVKQVERMLKENPPEAFSEGSQDFNKVEPYAVCLAGKPVKQFDYYEDARRFHDNWIAKLYREGDKDKADKITLMPIMKEMWAPRTRDTNFKMGDTASHKMLGPVTVRRVNRDGSVEVVADRDQKSYRVRSASLDEASMDWAAHKPTGPKFGGYLKGTDPAPTEFSNKGVGGCEESENSMGQKELDYLIAKAKGMKSRPDPALHYGDEHEINGDRDRVQEEQPKSNTPPRNFVVKNMKQSGQGKHKDMKRAAKQGDVKHKGKELEVDEGIAGNMCVRSTPMNLRKPKVVTPKLPGGPHSNALKKARAKGVTESDVEEGAKVDRMQKHIAKSEKDLGHSKKDAEAIGWATLNKRGYLDNANKKKHTNESINLTESVTYRLWESAGRKIVEAQLTADQIQQLFQQAQQGATAAGGNRTMIGKGKDVATAVNKAWEDLKTKVQNSGPVQGIDAKYDQAAEKLKQATGGDQGVMKYVQKYRDFAKAHPIAQSLIYSALIAAAGISGAGVGGAAALGLFKMVDKLLQGEKFSSAAYSGAKTGAMAYGAGQVGQAMKGGDQGMPPDSAYKTTYSHDTGVVDIPSANPAMSQAMDAGQRAQGYTSSKAYLDQLAKSMPTPKNFNQFKESHYIDRNLTVYTWMLNESVGLPKGGVQLTNKGIRVIFEAAYSLQSRLNEGILDNIKNKVTGAASNAVGAIANKARTVGQNLTTKVTADKLQSAWKKAGSPTDSDEVAQVLQQAGVSPEVINQIYASMKIPTSTAQTPPADTNTAQATTQAAGAMKPNPARAQTDTNTIQSTSSDTSTQPAPSDTAQQPQANDQKTVMKAKEIANGLKNVWDKATASQDSMTSAPEVQQQIRTMAKDAAMGGQVLENTNFAQWAMENGYNNFTSNPAIYESARRAFAEIKKGQKDSNGYTKCWPGHHAAGTKKGKNGGQVRNCVPNESMEEAAKVDPNAPFNYDDWSKSGKTTTPRHFGSKGAGTKLAQQTRDAQKKNQQGVAEGDYPDGSSIRTPGADEWKQQYQQAVMAVKNAKTQQEYEAASDRASRIKDLLTSKGVQVGPVLGQQGVAEGYKINETEAWQRANKKDKTDGMSKKAVKSYRREHPGSKLQTAVTTKPSKLKKGSKASKRRSSYCSRSKGQMKMHSISCAKTPDKAICKARRRWHCESQEQFDMMLREAVEQGTLHPGQYYIWEIFFDDGTKKRIKVTKDDFDPKAYYAKQNKAVINVDYNWEPHNG